MFKKIFSTALTVAFLVQPGLAFAEPHGGGRDFRGGRPEPRGGPYGGFRGGDVVHRLPAGYISLMAAGLTYLYCEGLFYRYTPAGYVIATPPMGAIVPALPPGYTTVFVNGIPYYYYGYTYYTPAPNGYVVATPPATMSVPPPAIVPAQAVLAAPTPTAALGTPAVAPHPALYEKAKEETGKDVYEIYIPNGNGSYTSVTLRKTEKGFLGPQGEFYQDHPTVEQLRARYTKK
jgi:hypothetical protein